jgi:hypothetical protein
MKHSPVAVLRILGAIHVVAGVLLLPFCGFFGLLLAPLLALGPVWLVVLGFRLGRPSTHVVRQLQRTHLASLVVALLMCLYGFFALRAAEHSAAAGGGLLGAFGLIPLALGILLLAVAVLSLWLLQKVRLPLDKPAS